MDVLFNAQKVNTEISTMTSYWSTRNSKFKEWYEILLLVDKLAAKGMESYVSNEPATFYQMAHYLLTKGEISHSIPVLAESAGDLDLRAKVHRGCQYLWREIDRGRKLGGSDAFIDDLAFYLLVLGWYSVAMEFQPSSGMLKAQVWNPADVYPKYSADKLISCVHTYQVTMDEAKYKADKNQWDYKPSIFGRFGLDTNCTLNDFFVLEGDTWLNMVLIDGKPVTGMVERPEMSLLVSPVGGYPDKGSINAVGTRSRGAMDWRQMAGKGIFEVNAGVTLSFNKWKSMIAQILRDTAQPIHQEITATPQATPEQLRERGALFHYTPGEPGLQRLPPASIPIELQSNLMEQRREMQKGGFNDAVFGMMEGQAGYALSLLASSSANQILYPYMDGKHFVISEADRFWLSNLKSSGKTFQVKGKILESIKPADIPTDVSVIVESDVATPKDWLERGTIGGMVRLDLDKSTLLTEIYKMSDPQGIIRAKRLDTILDHPMSLNIEMIAGYMTHANYLEKNGDIKQANLFRKAAQALESQLAAPPAGAAAPVNATQVASEVAAGASQKKPIAPSSIMPPETKGFTPSQLRNAIGRGTLQSI